MSLARLTICLLALILAVYLDKTLDSPKTWELIRFNVSHSEKDSVTVTRVRIGIRFRPFAKLAIPLLFLLLWWKCRPL